MGTWGTGILSDDTARDLYDEFVELYDAGIELSEIRRRIEEEYRASLEAMDEGPLVWLALAKGQWECDALDADVLARIERIVTTGEGLERWREAGSNLLAKRRRVLTRFLEQLRQPKETPRKRRPLKKHQAVYEVGTCLAVRLPNGEWGAAIVLAADNSHKTEGKNWVAALDWKGPNVPTPDIFERRDWIMTVFKRTPLDPNETPEPDAAWCLARSHHEEAAGLQIVGRTALRSTDPASGRRLAGWNFPRFAAIRRFKIPW